MARVNHKKEAVVLDPNGYLRFRSDGKLVHRHIAYHEIYLKARPFYSLPFRKYVVHHIDEDKLNNDVDNLELMTPEEHTAGHEIDWFIENNIDDYAKIQVHEKCLKVGRVFLGCFLLFIVVLAFNGSLPVKGNPAPFLAVVGVTILAWLAFKYIL